jgi:ABC-type antimicrobial peptide transport system permease subunit
MDVTDAHGSGEYLRERSLPELLKTLANDLSTLVHEEIELAKAELTQKAKLAGMGAGMFGGAAVAGVMTLGTLTACIVALLALAMPVWVAALIVTVVWGVVTGVLAISGKRRVQAATPPVPEQAIETTKEDVRWAKTRMQSGRR